MGESTVWTQLAVIAAVSASHMSMPNHWLPFSLVGRAHRWSLKQTLLLTLASAMGHVTVTVVVVAAISEVGGAFLSHDAYTFLSSGILFLIGAYYLYSHVSGRAKTASCCNDGSAMETAKQLSTVQVTTDEKGSTTKEVPSSEEKETGTVSRAAALSLFFLTAMTPCVGTMPVLINVLSPPVAAVDVLAVWSVLLVTAASVMCALVTVSYVGASTMNIARIRRYERLILGVMLMALALLTVFVLADDHHDHGHDHGHVHGLVHGHVHEHHGHHEHHEHIEGLVKVAEGAEDLNGGEI